MKLLINNSISTTQVYDITLADEDIEDEEYYLENASKFLSKNSISHHLALKGSYCSFTLDQQKVNLDEISANTVLSFLSDFLAFELEYVPRGLGCEVCFELIEKKRE